MQLMHVQKVAASDLGDVWQVQHQMAPTFVGDSIHETEGDKASEAMTGGSLLGGPGMTEMPGLQAALAAASAAMQAAGQSMPPPAPLTQQPPHSLSQVCFLYYLATCLLPACITTKSVPALHVDEFCTCALPHSNITAFCMQQCCVFLV